MGIPKGIFAQPYAAARGHAVPPALAVPSVRRGSPLERRTARRSAAQRDVQALLGDDPSLAPLTTLLIQPYQPGSLPRRAGRICRGDRP